VVYPAARPGLVGACVKVEYPTGGLMPAVVALSPTELAAALGLDAGDATLLATGPVQVPAARLAAWGERASGRELLVADVALLLGVPVPAVYQSMATAAAPRLRCRRTGSHLAPRRTVAPADLVAFLRERQAARANDPVD
jgi:hypothetical protein